MGIFSSRRWMGLTPSVCTVLCFMLSACNSTDEPIEEALSNVNPEMIHLSNGDVVVLSDTTTYTVDAAEIDDVVMMSEKASEDLFGPVSRATTTGLRAYGFDSQEPETDWKKYQLNNWQKYGVSPAIYVGRYVRVHKNLSIEKGTYAVPADYTSESVPADAKMGWDGKTTVIGFTPTTKSDYISDGVTRIFIINCDLSGRVYNKNIPEDPSKFVWAYKLETKVDIWE